VTYGASGVLWHGERGVETLCALEDIRLPGRHNLANVAAAAAMAKSFGVEDEAIRRAVRGFTGVEHRLEQVRELNGVRYINDTAATAPEAAIAALHSFNAPIVLIAGGADKNLPFETFAEAITARAKALVLLQGSATPRLIEALQIADCRLQIEDVLGPFDDFERAIRAAQGLAAPGGVVLLSPGCASFGMFRNEFHRGEEFRRIVEQLTG
jgi:UDP-N-acetylmuramoylalanine--D-glutamate ligase